MTLTSRCKDLDTMLNVEDSLDLNGIELGDNLYAVYIFLSKTTSSLEVLKFIAKFNLAPILSFVPRIFLIIPTSAASGERRFPKLNVIENFLRSSSSQPRSLVQPCYPLSTNSVINEI